MEQMVHWLDPCVLETENLSIENNFSLQSEDLGDCWPNRNATTATISNSGSSVKVGKEKSSKKRKAEKPLLVGSDDEYRKTKDSKNTSKENSNNKEGDYIHVRARRGQATDSHSLAERVRRERISKRMKYLQDLVPGCDRITGKAGMLDEIINYVQSLQRQVEFLSMKLATVDPRLDLNMEGLFSEEITLPSNFNISTVDPSSIFQFNSLQQAVTVPEPIFDSSLNVQITNVAWESEESELHNLYDVEFHQGREASFPPYSVVQGNLLSNNLKMEM